METDCLELVDLWVARQTTRLIIAPIVLEIEELASCFNSFVIHHVRRHANNPAHLCAQLASTLEVSECWMDSPPSFAVTSVLADASAVNVE